MPEAVESVRDTLNAAFEAAERPAPERPERPERQERAPPPPREARESRVNGHDEAPEVTEPESPSQDEPERAVDRPRDQFGRFLRTNPETPAEQPEAPQEPSHEITDQPEQREPEQDDGPAILAPQSWSAAARETWHQLPRAIQQEVDRREREMQRHFQQRAEQVNVLEPIAQAIQPYRSKLALKGVNPASAVQQLLEVQELLDRDPVRGIAHVAQAYGVDLRQFAHAFQQAQQPQDPVLRDLNERVQRQDQLIQSWQQQAQAQEQSRINNEVAAFAADTRNNPYFEHVRGRMAELMGSGAAPTLANAYKLACAENEQIQAAIAQASRTAERSQRSQQERAAADRARRAAVSVSGSPYGGSGGGQQGKSNATIRQAIESAMDGVA